MTGHQSRETGEAIDRAGLTDSQLRRFASDDINQEHGINITVPQTAGQVTVSSVSNKPPEEVKKTGPLYLNLEQTIAKKAYDETVERRKNAPKKTILEMYRTIGAVNGPGWRPMPKRPVLETSICLMMD